MGFYSFVGIAEHPVGIPDPMILLDTGVNTFTAQTEDLDGLLQLLATEGVTVTKVYKLDEHERVTLQDSILLPGEVPQDHQLCAEEEDP